MDSVLSGILQSIQRLINQGMQKSARYRLNKMQPRIRPSYDQLKQVNTDTLRDIGVFEQLFTSLKNHFADFLKRN